MSEDHIRVSPDVLGEYVEPRFTVGQLKRHFQTMKQGCQWMGGDLVFGDGQPVPSDQIEAIVEHAFNVFSLEERIDLRLFGKITLTQFNKALQKRPFRK